MTRRILVAVLVAVAAGTAATLALAAAVDAWMADSAILLSVVAVWIVQPLYVLARNRRRSQQ